MFIRQINGGILNQGLAESQAGGLEDGKPG
jgi:hypothetical protein